MSGFNTDNHPCFSYGVETQTCFFVHSFLFAQKIPYETSLWHQKCLWWMKQDIFCNQTMKELFLHTQRKNNCCQESIGIFSFFFKNKLQPQNSDILRINKRTTIKFDDISKKNTECFSLWHYFWKKTVFRNWNWNVWKPKLQNFCLILFFCVPHRFFSQAF